MKENKQTKKNPNLNLLRHYCHLVATVLICKQATTALPHLHLLIVSYFSEI